MSDMKVMKDEDNATLTVERTFNGSVSEVWQAWTTPETLEKWWSHDGWVTTIKQYDLKPGGAWLFSIKCVDKKLEEYGMDVWTKAIFETVEPEKEISYKDYFADENGTVDPNMPAGSVVKTTFSETRDGKCKIVTHAVFASPESFRQMLEMDIITGITEMYDLLDKELAK